MVPTLFPDYRPTKASIESTGLVRDVTRVLRLSSVPDRLMVDCVYDLNALESSGRRRFVAFDGQVWSVWENRRLRGTLIFDYENWLPSDVAIVDGLDVARHGPILQLNVAGEPSALTLYIPWQMPDKHPEPTFEYVKHASSCVLGVKDISSAVLYAMRTLNERVREREREINEDPDFKPSRLRSGATALRV